MKKTHQIIPLFKLFIKDSEKGRRLKKNGEKLKIGTIKNYKNVLKNLDSFSTELNFNLRICENQRLNMREYVTEKNYWKKFYLKFTRFLYRRGVYDNYVGQNIKILRTFFNWLKYEKDFNTGDFHMRFYVRKQDVEILVLSTERLKFLIHDKAFHQKLPYRLKAVKDFFVFGCTTGLRYSDLIRLTNKNFICQNGVWYLKTKSKKTKIQTVIKLPNYALDIYKKYKCNSAKTYLFKKHTLNVFNTKLKLIGELAKFTEVIEYRRERLGTLVNKSKENIRFCDKMSSHMMRRTSITTLLLLGMPSHLVKKISGHSANSNSFNRYVFYAQSYIDTEIDKIYSKLEA